MHISQISPNGFWKVMYFLLPSKALGVEPDVDIFHYFYYTTSIGYWITFSSIQRVIDIFHHSSNSIKNWKHEFFFVDSTAFPFPIAFGKTSKCLLDNRPVLSFEKVVIFQALSSQVIK